jgi:hypothetical protein
MIFRWSGIFSNLAMTFKNIGWLMLVETAMGRCYHAPIAAGSGKFAFLSLCVIIFYYIIPFSVVLVVFWPPVYF